MSELDDMNDLGLAATIAKARAAAVAAKKVLDAERLHHVWGSEKYFDLYTDVALANAPILARAVQEHDRFRGAWEEIFDYAVKNGLREPFQYSVVSDVIRFFDTWRAENEFYQREATKQGAEIERRRRVLQTIARGKIKADNTHPLGEHASMSMRFVSLAAAALAPQPEPEGG